MLLRRLAGVKGEVRGCMGPVTQKAPPTMSEDSIERGFRLNSRQRPSLPRSRPRSTIGPEGLNFRVRDGNGCDPLGKITEKIVIVERPSGR